MSNTYKELHINRVRKFFFRYFIDNIKSIKIF